MKNKLQNLLSDLHAELGAAQELDADARQELKALAQQIETLVTADEDAGILNEGLEQVQEAAVSFESEHPRIAGVLSSIVDVLGKMGI